MIVTVTLNTGIDHTIVVPEFRWGKTIRSTESAVGMGGKAIDASWVLGELGIENLALGFAAGDNGRKMEKLLRQKGVRTRFTWTGGETRLNTVVISGTGDGQTTFTGQGLTIAEKHLKEFLRIYNEALDQCDCLIIGGSLPANVPVTTYTEIIGAANKRDIPVIFDASGPGLLAGLEGRPTLIKPNRAELESLVGRPLRTLREVHQAASQIRDQYQCMVLATLGENGALAVTNDETIFIAPLDVELRSAAGAGDAILAGLAHSFAAGLSLKEGLRLGFAAATAVLLTLGTADCRREDVIRLQSEIQMQQYDTQSVGDRIHGGLDAIT